MRLTLKKFQSIEGRRGWAFNVEIWHEGKKVCDVDQSGVGAHTSWDWYDQKAEMKFNCHIKSLVDRGAFKNKGGEDEVYLLEMAEFRLERHRKLIFRLKEAPEYLSVKAKDSPKLRSLLKQKYGEVFEFVNDRYEQ